MEHDQFLFVIVESPTWLLYVSLLLIAVFFRFSRVLTVRNLDLSLLLLLSTALVVSASSERLLPRTGADLTAGPSAADAALSEFPSSAIVDSPELNPTYRWSSVVVLALSVLLIVRLMFDESLTRRPRLEQNLNQAGLTFLFFPAFTILMTGVFVKEPPVRNVHAVEAGVALLERREISGENLPTPAPTETLLAAGATKVAELSGRMDYTQFRSDTGRSPVEAFIARLLVVIAHSTVVMGLFYIGRRHFCSVQLGIAMCVLYLLLPCTAFNVHQLSHVVPAACLTWAFASYRKPAVAGILLGLACGTLFFAAFLLPLWAAFYGRKGSIRFGLSLCGVAAVVMVIFALTSENTDSFVNKLVMTANWTAYRLFDAATPMPQSAIGQVFLRILLAALFFVMLIAMTVIPRKRNLENLLANSTALIVAAQLWYPEDVGSYVLWYLPLLLLVIFRPRLDRFVPPEETEGTIATRSHDLKSQQAASGSLSRVTLYS
ncbi:MAG: hypothetical protein KDA81_04250 [Planctomycetaceae bacterium]|nr:hypothetical protein [Planctomycetaceae bacterium]